MSILCAGGALMAGAAMQAGVEGVVAAETQISGVDGEAGELVIRGFPVEEIAERATFEEVVYLLWNGILPDLSELSEFREELAAHRGLPVITLEVLRAATAER